MVHTNRVHHVTLLVTDLESAEAFYGGVMGLTRIQRPDFPSKGIWYEIGGIQVHIILVEQAEPISPRHLAFEVDDLDAVVRMIERMGLPIWGDIPVKGYVRKHCRDPFGNGIELLQPIEEGSSETSAPNPSSYVDAKGEWQIGEEAKK